MVAGYERVTSSGDTSIGFTVDPRLVEPVIAVPGAVVAERMRYACGNSRTS